MFATPYPKTPMFRIAYTPLSERQIADRLSAVAAAGPKSVSPVAEVLAGETLRIVTDKGPVLDYRFRGPNRLSLSEGSGRAIQAGYAAHTLDKGSILFFAHLIPGTLRGYAVAIDRDTDLATVFELWFGGVEKAKREVMREVYQGYVARSGKEAPAARHVPTNRIEGKGFYWKQDNGAETLEFYPSISYTHFVELSRQGGELGYSAPADYIKINDDFYIYTRTESEFSGTFTIYVMDLNRIEQVGLRLGFDVNDALDYYLFRGQGEWLGQIAQFEKFGDTSGGPPPPRPGSTGQKSAPAPGTKGARGIYRPIETMPKMTKAEVDAAVAQNKRVFQRRIGAGSGAAGMATNGAPASDWLAGKKMTLRYDNGPAIDYRFDSADSLQWRNAGAAGAWTQARYQAWESAPGVFIFGHLLEGTPNHDGHMIVADFDHGLATCFNGYLNTPYFANEAGARTWFGVIEMDGITAPEFRRHKRTDELLGRALTWNYAPGLTSMHLYSTPNTVSWIIFTEAGAGGLEWSGSGDFVKIRDDLYFAYWLEEACNGTLGTILINMRTMHDAGIGYHCGPDGLSMSQVGAHSRHAGRFDIAKYFQPRTEGRPA
jgi:hypothetical protein